MKSLKAIQIIAKVLRIVCIVAFVCCVVGASMCLATIILLPIIKDTVIYQGKTIEVLIADKSSTFAAVMTAAIFGLISCGVGIFLAKHTEKFFQREIEIGTPFKMEVVKSMRKVAIVHLIASVATAVVLGITYGVSKAITHETLRFDHSYGGSVGFAIALFVISLFCEYGADDKEEPKEKPEVKTLESKE